MCVSVCVGCVCRVYVWAVCECVSVCGVCGCECICYVSV